MGPSGGFPEDSAGARGEGLEPSITGPEPVVLPITPPPNGWTIRLAEVVGVVIAPLREGTGPRGAPPASRATPLGSPRLGIVEPVEVVEADDPAQSHP